MQIAAHCVVAMHYTLTDSDGNTLDSSAGGDPLVYLHGASNIIPGLEAALDGKTTGDQVEAVVQPADGYGEVDERLVDVVPHEAFQGVDEVQPGMQFQAHDSQGNARRIVVREVSDEGVTVDANHPLAGQVLHFDVTIEGVRAATEEEIAHGHVHG